MIIKKGEISLLDVKSTAACGNSFQTFQHSITTGTHPDILLCLEAQCRPRSQTAEKFRHTPLTSGSATESCPISHKRGDLQKQQIQSSERASLLLLLPPSQTLGTIAGNRPAATARPGVPDVPKRTPPCVLDVAAQGHKCGGGIILMPLCGQSRISGYSPAVLSIMTECNHEGFVADPMMVRSQTMGARWRGMDCPNAT